MDRILDGATNHFNFRELPNGKIILSEEAYLRLLGAVNLCAYSGSKGLEYGTFLYGKEILPNVVYFSIPSKYDDYEPQSKGFEVDHDRHGNELKMKKELMHHINGNVYSCIAHVHTHPYIGGTCRFFSNQDLKLIKTLQLEFQPEHGKEKYFFGGLLTVGPDNKPGTDEISFVFYDKKYGWYKITNISVYIDGTERPFNKVNDRPRI